MKVLDDRFGDRQDFGIATVLQTAQADFEWSASEETFQRPDKNDLIKVRASCSSSTMMALIFSICLIWYF